MHQHGAGHFNPQNKPVSQAKAPCHVDAADGV